MESIAARTRAVKFPPHEIYSAGVDWLTCSTSRQIGRELVRQRAQQLLDIEEGKGNRVQPMRMKRYAGWLCGSVGYGMTEDATLVRLSGRAAFDHWRDFITEADRVSRMDLQVTIRFQRPVNRLAEALYHQYETACRGRGRPPEGGLRLNTGGGQTFTIGKHTSDLWSRVYDKEKQSREPDYQRCYRWELQDQSNAAVHRARALSHAPDPGSSILCHLHSYFTSRGSPVPWEWSGIPLQCEVPDGRTDDNRKLEWFRTQVRPSVEDMVGRGLLMEVLTALGFGGQETIESEKASRGGLEWQSVLQGSAESAPVTGIRR
jgi:DNA relaxase NicK